MSKERLIELLDEGLNEWSLSGWASSSLFMEMSEYLAEHLLANGVIVPPCKVGDDVYIIEDEEVTNQFVLEVIQHRNGMWYFAYVPYDKHQNVRWFYPKEKASSSDIGKTVFLTREEAEAKLKEGAE